MINILTTAWLEDLAQQPSSTAYRLLAPHYKEAYTNERFVFYNAQCVDAIHFDHLISVFDYLDISRFFCLVITNQQTTYDYFKQAGCSVEFDTEVTPSAGVLNPVTPLYPNDTMCVHAWAGLHLTPAGDTKLCCNYRGTIPNTNISTHEFDDILQSEYMNSIREQFRNGKTPEGCVTCSRREAAGLDSKRTLSAKRLNSIFGYVDWESNNLSNVPKFLGGHIGNLCNLKCRICSPDFSSQIAVEEFKSSKDTLITYNWNKNHEDFWSFVRRNEQLVHFEILGGEPLLLPENKEFLRYLINTGRSKECTFEIVTNGTQYLDVFDQIGKFKRFIIALSIDNINQRFEYERKNASWDTVNCNVDRLLAAKTDNVDISVCVTVSALNVLYLPETIEWIRNKGLDFYFNIVNHPWELSLLALNSVTVAAVIKKLGNNTDFKSLINYIKSISPNNNNDELCNYIRNKDIQRSENLAISHPELAQLIGYVL